MIGLRTGAQSPAFGMCCWASVAGSVICRERIRNKRRGPVGRLFISAKKNIWRDNPLVEEAALYEKLFSCSTV